MVYYESLQNTVKELDLGDRVCFSGEISREQYIIFLKNAHVLVLAKPFNSFHAGHSSKVVEYLFSGNPIVMMKSDAYAEMLQDDLDVLFATKYDIHLFSTLLFRAISDDTLRARLSKSSVSKAHKLFNTNLQAQELMKFLVSL